MVRVRKYVPLATNPHHHLKNLISCTHYPTLHPYPLLFRLLSPFSPLCYEQVRAAGHRRWVAKADPPPTLRSDSGGSEQLAVGIASTARVSAIFIFFGYFCRNYFHVGRLRWQCENLIFTCRCAPRTRKWQSLRTPGCRWNKGLHVAWIEKSLSVQPITIVWFICFHICIYSFEGIYVLA